MSSATADRPKLNTARVSTGLIETPGLARNLTVSGAAGDDCRALMAK